MIIYGIKSPSNKWYVGQTINTLAKRKSQHLADTRCVLLHNAIKKYGDNLYWTILDRASSIEELNLKEARWIKLLKSLKPNGYNLQSGGDNYTHSKCSNLKVSKAKRGILFTEEHKAKLSKAHKGSKRSIQHSLNISKALKGRKITWKDKISNSNKGRVFTEEHRKNIAKAMTGENSHRYGKKHSKETIEKIRQSSVKRWHK